MDRFPPARAATRTLAQHHDALDLRAAVAAALADAPHDEQALRDSVWTYVRNERLVGVPPAAVIVALTEVVGEAHEPASEAGLARTRDVILWCVEAYFGHLGGDALDRDRATTSEPSLHAPAGDAR